MATAIEKEGKTISEAVMNACEALGVSKNEVEVEVVREDSKGVLGIGSKSAIVRAEIKTDGLSEKAFRAKKTFEAILSFLFSTPQGVKIEESDSRITLEVWTVRDKKYLVGKNGELVKAIEYMVGKIASKNSEEGRGKRVAVNITDNKDRQKETRRPQKSRRSETQPKPSNG